MYHYYHVLLILGACLQYNVVGASAVIVVVSSEEGGVRPQAEMGSGWRVERAGATP